MRKGSVLVIGHPDSDLVLERCAAGRAAGLDTHFFSLMPVSAKFRDSPNLDGVIEVPQLRRGGHTYARLSLLTAFVRLQPCIVHVHYAIQDPEYVGAIARLHPLVVSVMGGDVDPNQGFTDGNMAPVRRLLDAADVITSKSSFMDRALREIGPYGDKVKRITWGVDLGQFVGGPPVDAVRERFDVAADDALFFCARAAEPRLLKHVVIRAFARALKRLDGKACLLVSEYNPESAYLESLHDLVDELGIAEHVRFVGSLNHSEIVDCFNTCDAVISVPHSDGLPQTVLQAMACGAPVVLSDIPAVREIQDWGCALALVRPDDVAALADTLEQVALERGSMRARARGNRAIVMREADASEQYRRMGAIYGSLLPLTLSRKVIR